MTTDPSEPFRTVPNDSETFGTIPNSSEPFRNLPKVSERTEHHTLTAREVTRMFEQAGVARTERSVINWCHADKHGVSRLDCWYDTNERKFFITPQSVELAIKEEQAKVKIADVPKPSETQTAPQVPRPNDTRETPESPVFPNAEGRALRAKVRRLEVDAEVNKRYIEKLETEREKFIERMIAQSREIGLLEKETEQLKNLLEAPKHDRARVVETSTDRTPATERDAEYTEANTQPTEVL